MKPCEKWYIQHSVTLVKKLSNPGDTLNMSLVSRDGQFGPNGHGRGGRRGCTRGSENIPEEEERKILPAKGQEVWEARTKGQGDGNRPGININLAVMNPSFYVS